MARSSGVVMAVLLWAGCGAGPGVDAGVQIDAGISDDAGPGDAGLASPDAGPSDAGGVDAGADDAGTDAGRDAGVADGGSDAGNDAGLDAGLDAGPTPPGCRANSDCASGLCLASGHCKNCQADQECADGGVCGTGECSAPCGDGGTCELGFTCCAGRCIDPSRDPLHCSGCGTACTATQFCGRGACVEATFAALCEQPVATLLLDGLMEDDIAGLSMRDGVASSCVPAIDAGTASAFDAGYLRANGEPLQLGELLVAGGGNFGQRVVRWLELNGHALVSDTSTSTQAIYTLQDGGVVSSVPMSMLSSSRDRILIQLARAPSGSLVLNAAGFHGPGTLAAAQYFVQSLLPNRANLTTRWYVLEWTDNDFSGGPSAGDVYTVLASGP